MKNSESLKEFKKLNSEQITEKIDQLRNCLLYTSPSPRD